jgi:DNA-binding HxlR family transcriptional regulator
VQLTLDLMRGKWKAHILWELRGRSRGFNELLAALNGVSHKVLAEQLRSLERDGFVARRERTGRRTEYTVTPFGRTLRPALDALAKWAKSHHTDVGVMLDWPTPLRHVEPGPSRRVSVGFEASSA